MLIREKPLVVLLMNTLFFLPVSSSSSLGSIISLVGTSTPLGCPPRGVTLSGEAAAPCDVKKWSKILPQPRRIFVFLNINLTSFLYSNIKKQFQSIFATETQHIVLLWLKLAFSWQFWSFFNIIYCLIFDKQAVVDKQIVDIGDNSHSCKQSLQLIRTA